MDWASLSLSFVHIGSLTKGTEEPSSTKGLLDIATKLRSKVSEPGHGRTKRPSLQTVQVGQEMEPGWICDSPLCTALLLLLELLWEPDFDLQSLKAGPRQVQMHKLLQLCLPWGEAITRGWPPSPPPLWPRPQPPWWGGGHWGPRSWTGGGRSGSTPRRLGYLGTPTSAPPVSPRTPSFPLLPSLCSSQVWTSFLLTQFPLLFFLSSFSVYLFSIFLPSFVFLLPSLPWSLFSSFTLPSFFHLSYSSQSLSPIHFSLLLF